MPTWGSRLVRVAVVGGVFAAILLAVVPPASAAPSISAVNPASPVLAGSTVFVNAGGFPPSSTVSFRWDGALAGATATSDPSGSIAGEPVAVPVSLAPGPHTLDACSPVPACSAIFAVEVGPTVTTTAISPVHRGQVVSVTVAGLQASQTAIFGWNGVFAAAPAHVIPDLPSFTVSVTVPADAPAASVLDVCERMGPSGTTCIATPRTNGTLSLTVQVAPPTAKPPAPQPPATKPTTTAVLTTAIPTTAVPTTAPPTVAARPRSTTLLIPVPPPTSSLSKSASPVTSREQTATPTFPPSEAVPAPPSALPTHPAAALFTSKAAVHLEVAAFALLALLGGGAMSRGIAGLALGGGAAAEAGAAARSRPKGGKATSAKVKAFKGGREAVASGDRSRTWRWPGTARIDGLALALPVRVATRSPLLARVLIDSSYLRAILGSASLLAPIAGAILGALALQGTHAQASPPSALLLATLAVLGVLDAAAGLLAAAVFAAGVAVAGNLDSVTSIRTMIGLAVIWFAVPLIAGAARPLRRHLARDPKAYRQRVGDLIIASLIGAWTIQKMIQALPGLAQQQLSITQHADTVALTVLGASAARMVLESAAATWYPLRLVEVQPATVPRAGAGQRVAAACLRSAIFLFVVVAFIGNHWQLWVGGVLFLAPQLLSIYEHRFPNSSRLYAWLPRGLLKLVVMMFVGAAFGSWVLHALSHRNSAALDAFVLLTIPGLVVGGLELFGRDGNEPDEGWARWLGGAVVLAVGILFVLGYLS